MICHKSDSAFYIVGNVWLYGLIIYGLKTKI